MFHKTLTIFLPAILLLGIFFKPAFGDEFADQELFAVITMDEQAYIYHTQQLGLVNGFHVERRAEGEDWEQITEEPVFPVSDGREFQAAVGDLYPLLQESADTESPQEVFLSLMTRPSHAHIASVLHPDVGKALARLYVDEDPPVARQVDYRFVVTNSQGEPSGEILSESFQLDPQIPEAPENVSGDYEGAEVTLEWEYPGSDFIDDAVTQFVIYERTEGGSAERLEDGILRRTDVDSHHRRFEVEELNREYELFVIAKDAAGQHSDPSETLTITPEDNIPPQPISNIDLHRIEDTIIEVTWPVSPDPDAAGYHVFRFEQDEDEEWQQLTEEQLGVTENVFRDTTITGSSHYNYKIRVYDEHDNESDPSNEATMFIEEFEPPEPVSNVEAELREDSTVSISWEETPTENINSYSITRREVHPDESETYSQINDGRHIETDITDMGIAGAEFPEGRTLEYGVAAVGPSAMQSDTVTTTVHIPLTTPPEPPVDIEVSSAEADRVNIRWSASTSRTVTDYHIYRVDQPEDTDIPGREELEEEQYEEGLISRESAAERFIRDEEAETGQAYRYLIAAVDSAGNYSEPAVSEELFHRSSSPPHPVRNLQAREIDGEVTLRWEPVQADDLDGYIIYRSSIATGDFEVIEEVSEEDTEWNDPEGEPGKWYRVLAVDTSGNKSRETRATQATE